MFWFLCLSNGRALLRLLLQIGMAIHVIMLLKASMCCYIAWSIVRGKILFQLSLSELLLNACLERFSSLFLASCKRPTEAWGKGNAHLNRD